MPNGLTARNECRMPFGMMTNGIVRAAHEAYERAVCEAKLETDTPWDRMPAQAFQTLGLSRLDWPEFLLAWIDADEQAHEGGARFDAAYYALPDAGVLASKGTCTCGHDDLDHRATCGFCSCRRFVRARGKTVVKRRPNAAHPLSGEAQRRIRGAQNMMAVARAAGLDF